MVTAAKGVWLFTQEEQQAAAAPSPAAADALAQPAAPLGLVCLQVPKTLLRPLQSSLSNSLGAFELPNAVHAMN